MIYRAFFRLLILLRVGPERAHRLASLFLRALTAPRPVLLALDRLLGPRDPALRVSALGTEFRSPLGCGAGVDKSATWFDALYALGFGFVEVGTVTAEAQPGNPGRRVSRLPRDRALINAMGFPNDGATAAARRLARRRIPDSRIGVNVGKTRRVPIERAIDDYRASLRALAPLSDFVVLNVSSPNTPGLTELQSPERLDELIAAAREELRPLPRPVPLLVKIGADLSADQVDAIADLALELELDGLVATNTSVDTSLAPESAEEIAALPHGGGLSGPPLAARSLEILSRLHTRLRGRVPLIAVGGIETPEDAWRRILAGATLVQAHTGFVYGGPLWPRRMNRGLARLLRESEFPTLEAAIGAAARDPGAGEPRRDASAGRPSVSPARA